MMNKTAMVSTLMGDFILCVRQTLINSHPNLYWGFPCGTVVKNLPANSGNVRDTDSTPGSGRSPGGGNGNLL